MVAIIDVLNRAYNVVEFRPWWKRRLLAIGLTVAFALFVLLALVLVLIGPALAERVAGWIGLESAVVTAWSLLRWPTMILLIVLGVDLVYHFAPNRPQRWAWITPGSLLATGLWLLGSFGFKLYVANFAEYNATYGTIGGVIVTLLWFYVSALSILIGAELNGVIAQAQAEARDRTRRAGREEALSPP
jgi:membrane protein